MRCGVYKIQNLRDGMRYVGASRQIEKRWTQHDVALRNGTHLNLSLQKEFSMFGSEIFQYSVLELSSEELLFEAEKRWIRFYSPYVYNVNKHSKESLIHTRSNATLIERNLVRIKMTKIESVLEKRKADNGENKNAYYGTCAGRANTTKDRIARFAQGKMFAPIDVAKTMLAVANETLETDFGYVEELFEEVK